MTGLAPGGRRGALLGLAMAAAVACGPLGTSLDANRLQDFGRRYAVAWCNHDAPGVAAFFEERGSLQINGATPAVGRTAIAAAAQGFMTAFPDMVVSMEEVDIQGDRAIFRWVLNGTNTGPGGTGKAVRIRGFEEWTFGADGLIAQSQGHFDAHEYARQLRVGYGVY